MLLMPGLAMADAISPETFSATLGIGESVTITKTVTVAAEAPTTAPVDVFFLADTTGSMGSYISAVQSSVLNILNNTSGLGDVQYAVGEYRDKGDDFIYRLDQSVTNNTAAIQAGVNAWDADGGGDWKEGQLTALTELTEATTGWREDSTRVVVWFGDAPGHESSNGNTLSSTIAALQDANISVEAIDNYKLNEAGQATAIAEATGGHYYGDISSSSIVATIEDAITTAIDTYSSVSLDLSSVPAGVEVTTTAGYTGAWKRDEARDFSFDVTFTGIAAGDYNFDIAAMVDGGKVAWEKDSISVRSVDPVPEPASMLLFGAGLVGLTAIRRRKN